VKEREKVKQIEERLKDKIGTETVEGVQEAAKKASGA